MSTAFGKYRLLQRIGGGRLSQVFRVGRNWPDANEKAGANGRPRACPPLVLKRVAPELIGQQAFVQLVAREAGLLSRLKHPNLCTAQEMGVIDGCAFVTLDFVDGCTLRALLRRVTKMGIGLPQSAVLALTIQLAEVLDYLHQQGDSPLAHLDLSPQNVMIGKDGQVKLIDFGIARFLDGSDPPPLGGRIAGTIGYMSPEQARGAKLIDGRADQFALGILLWEMLTGRRLFPGDTQQTWRRMRAGDILDLAEAAPDLSPELVAITTRAMAVVPEERYPDLIGLAAALRELSSAPLSGKRPLAALTTHLMGEQDFDPFDAVSLANLSAPEQSPPRSEPKPEPKQPPSMDTIPTGELQLDAYAELEISVDHGAGTPSAQMRAAVPVKRHITQPPETEDGRPQSPFLEPSASFELEPVSS